MSPVGGRTQEERAALLRDIRAECGFPREPDVAHDRHWAQVMLRIFGWLTLTMLGVAAAMEVL